jgi:hypothetical protein
VPEVWSFGDMTLGEIVMNFAQSSRLFVVLGILALYFGGVMKFGSDPNVARLAGLFSIGLGVVLGILSLFGVGRPAKEPYKAPWISLSLGCVILLFVVMGGMSAAFRGTAQGHASVAGDAVRAPFIDPTNGFRLDHPGEGWTILTKEELRTLNDAAAAVAMKGPDSGGFVFVETLDPDFRFVGREQEVGKDMVDQTKLDDKRVVFIRPDELDGHKAVRCQMVGNMAGRRVRCEDVALIANGRLYRLTAFGPIDQTSEDGLAFRPFMDAFRVLPTETQAAPHVPAAPPVPK